MLRFAKLALVIAGAFCMAMVIGSPTGHIDASRQQGACTELTDGWRVCGARQQQPDARVMLLFLDVQYCTGADRFQLGWIRWFVADSIFDGDGAALYGMTEYGLGQADVYVEVGPDSLMAATIKHELVHVMQPYAADWSRIMQACSAQ